MTQICVTCGTQFPPSGETPRSCPICQDDRQFIGPQGQEWISLNDIVPLLVPLLEIYRDNRHPGEGFGDYCHRLGADWLSVLTQATVTGKKAAAGFESTVTLANSNH